QLVAVYSTAGADNRITRAGYDMGVAVDWTRLGFQLPRKTRVQAREALRPRVAQVEIGEHSPDRDRGSRQHGRINLAEPAEESIRQLPRDVLRQQKAEILPQSGFSGVCSHCHISVRMIE